MLNKQALIYSAALLGSTFVFIGSLSAEPAIVESQPDGASGTSSLGTLGGPESSARTSSNGPSAAFVENLMFQVQDLQQQVAEQRGKIEELSYQLDVMREEQRERYIDLDQRILSLQQNPGSASASIETAPAASADFDAVSDEDILAEYNAAREHIRAREFPEAISSLQAFADSHPEHSLTPNAWYWLGEVQLASRNVDEARTAFQTVIDQFPDNAKVPDSLYKLGIIAQQGGNSDQARQLFQRVITDYPDSQSAQLAQARLNSN
ncbi:tol-pal system protein YbgF [Saccharospirillum sp. HFRX-1]|uniref:tol-pal system protein YbgF n=1 Tax=unclassified Saccharospirillum TaxID=2633430 RepID=UPI00371AEFA3